VDQSLALRIAGAAMELSIALQSTQVMIANDQAGPELQESLRRAQELTQRLSEAVESMEDGEQKRNALAMAERLCGQLESLEKDVAGSRPT